MKKASASAPGKVILFGEHAVVYGRPAIAAPLAGVRAEAELEPLPVGDGFRIEAVDLNRRYRLAQAGPENALAAAVRQTLAVLGRDAPAAWLRVTSTIPLGRGLGSGAAVSAAVVRALANAFAQPLTPADVSEIVYGVEKLHHGTPSGIDNTVIAYEQPVYFVRERPIQRLGVARPFTLVIGDTGVAAATHRVVGDLRRRWQQHRYEGYFDEIGVLVAQARMLIEQGKADQRGLGKLMNENQEILATLALSSPELERLINAARQAGAWGAKLSGAGWGGNMIALSSPEPAAIEAIRQALLTAGAVGVMVTTVAPPVPL